MASDETFDSEWIQSLGGAEALLHLWQALQEDGGVPGAACTAAFRGMHAQLDTALEALHAMAVGTAAGTTNSHDNPTATAGTPPWLAPWLQSLARLGPWQEALGRARATHVALHRYTSAYSACATELIESIRSGLHDLERQLAEAAEAPDRTPPQSCRELYEWWLAAGEARHETLLGSERWAAAFGQLANATTELISSYQQQLDASLRSLDLPNREDFIDAQRRIVQLERRQRATAEREETATLRAEVAQLREEVTALRQQHEGRHTS
ncbi:MAG: poly(R)-hydroxyalkanoic acid synthase subunit PhaE [Halorhodospira sp.]